MNTAKIKNDLLATGYALNFDYSRKLLDVGVLPAGATIRNLVASSENGKTVWLFEATTDGETWERNFSYERPDAEISELTAAE